MRIEWLYEARCEFEEQLAYYRSRGGAEAAAGFAGKILGAVERLAAAPRAGVLRRETLLGKHGFRALLVEQYACIYRIEDDVVRVYHLTDASKDNLYEILGVASGATDREVQGTMRNNVFLKSTLRQPVKTALLLAVVALITFAFVSRGAEYLLVRQETERLGSYYRSIGTVESIGGEARMKLALKYLQNSPYVKTADQAYFGSAIMSGVYNAEQDYTADNITYFREDMFFYGTLERAFAGTSPDGAGGQTPSYRFYFKVDDVLLGYPEAVQAGDSIELINSVRRLWDNSVETCDLTSVYQEMEVGRRYLVRGEYAHFIASCHLRDSDGCGVYEFKQLIPDGPWFFPVEPGQDVDLSDPRLAGLEQQMRIIDDNQHAMPAIASMDVSALTAVMQNDWAPYLLEGRWPDRQDHDAGRRVCAIPEKLAIVRGLEVGGTLTMKLRDLSDYRYYGYLCTDEDLARIDDIACSETETYEIVGIYNTMVFYSNNFVFIPSSARPDTFGLGKRPDFKDNVFELTSPAVEAQFMVEAAEDLGTWGVRPIMQENGWTNFQAVAEPMQKSTLMSVLTFSVALVVTFCLAAFIYLRMRRKDIAIARALGVPVGHCIRDASLPVLLIAITGILSGGVIGWRYTLENAGETLRSLTEFGGAEQAALPGYWLAALCGGALLLMAALALGGVSVLARTPVLTLVQGGTAGKIQKPVQTVQETSVAPRPEVPAPAAAQRSSRPADAPVQVNANGAGHVLRFVWRHIARSRLKSALSILLAAVFTVGLAVIRLSIVSSEKKVTDLYDTTVVEFDITRDEKNEILHPRYNAKNDGFITTAVVQAIQETGFIQDAFLAGGNTAIVFPYEGEWSVGQSVSVGDASPTRLAVRSFDDLAEYTERSKDRLSITYHGSWDDSLFARDWSESVEDSQELFPVVLPKYLYNAYEFQPGDTIGVSCGSFRLCAIAGYYSGLGLDAPLLMPNSAVETMAGDQMLYAGATFFLDPAMNRDLSQFHTELDGIIDKTKSKLTLRTVVRDDELRQAVEPLEDSIVLMKLLYPVVLALSLLVAAGIAVLFVMTSAKEAAIMRVLGTSKLRSRVMLALQTAFTSAAGLLIGLAGVLAYTGRTRPELLAGLVGASALCAVLYLLAAIIGAAASSTVVTSKNPLELLQVRE